MGVVGAGWKRWWHEGQLRRFWALLRMRAIS
jgi:hypothetical protein